MNSPAKRTHQARIQTNEEILYWAKDSLGYVKLRIQFQTRTPDLVGRLRYSGLKGKSITVAIRSPGMAMQLIDAIEEFIEKFVPEETPQQESDQKTSFSIPTILLEESIISTPNAQRTKPQY